MKKWKIAQRQWTRLESDNPQEWAIVFYWNIIFFPKVDPLLIKDNQSKIIFIYKISLVLLDLAWLFT